jgi:hypothetical protein
MERARARIGIGIALVTLLAGPVAAQTFTIDPDPLSPILDDTSSGYTGTSWVDIDNDGKLDLYVNNNFLYRGDGNGGFTKLTTAIGSGITAALGNGNSWADYDNDGDLDVYIASRSSALYKNNGS